MEEQGEKLLKFQCFSTSIEPSFWRALAARKLDEWKLSEDPTSITAYFGNAESKADKLARLCFGPGSFHENEIAQSDRLHSSQRDAVIVPATLLLFNTPGAFTALDKNQALADSAAEIWKDMQSGAAVDRPELLLRCLLLCYADLKGYIFTYWAAFPALLSSIPFKVSGGVKSASSILGRAALDSIRLGLHELAKSQDSGSIPPFFVLVTENTREDGNAAQRVISLEQYEDLVKTDTREGDIETADKPVFCFVDPGTLPEYPGWPLRNFLMLLATRWRIKKATILCYRDGLSALSTTHEQDGTVECKSLVLQVVLGEGEPPSDVPKATGWEPRDGKGTLGPRSANLSNAMDPMKLAEQSLNLNLRLMLWRALPRLDLNLLAGTKCLLLGSGTLGCGVARCLLGWGVGTITFVDNGRVSPSNPVRQSLFEFSDCAGGGRFKAEAAAAAIMRIQPTGVIATGRVLTIPMPGHPLGTSAAVERAKEDVHELRDLIASHDVTFLLTDSRESRWLPSVIAAATDKLLINVALGLDSYLVQRHGGGSGHIHADSSPRLGCYFCTDVVAPENSLRDRTLDQQCTVTRPGLAPVASALAVELMVSLLHHPLKHHAPADINVQDLEAVDDDNKPLGLLPHQIRGYLTHFSHVTPATQAFDCCSGCCEDVTALWLAEGFDFVQKVCDNPGYLSEVSGLNALAEGLEGIDMVWDGSDSEEEGEHDF